MRNKFKDGIEDLEFEFTVLNAGTGSMTGTYTVKAFLSVDDVADAGDTVLGTWSGSQLPAGAAESFKARLSVPGSHADEFVIIVADPDNTVSESDEANNTAAEVINP